MSPDEESSYCSLLYRICSRELLLASITRSSRGDYGMGVSWGEGVGKHVGWLHAIGTGASLMVLYLHRALDSGLCGFIHTQSFGVAFGALALGCLHSRVRGSIFLCV